MVHRNHPGRRQRRLCTRLLVHIAPPVGVVPVCGPRVGRNARSNNRARRRRNRLLADRGVVRRLTLGAARAPLKDPGFDAIQAQRIAARDELRPEHRVRRPRERDLVVEHRRGSRRRRQVDRVVEVPGRSSRVDVQDPIDPTINQNPLAPGRRDRAAGRDNAPVASRAADIDGGSCGGVVAVDATKPAPVPPGSNVQVRLVDEAIEGGCGVAAVGAPEFEVLPQVNQSHGSTSLSGPGSGRAQALRRYRT